MRIVSDSSEETVATTASVHGFVDALNQEDREVGNRNEQNAAEDTENLANAAVPQALNQGNGPGADGGEENENRDDAAAAAADPDPDNDVV